MNTVGSMHMQAAYNRWMNERLYAVCAGMSDDERKRDLGAFFRSIHGTFNHLLLTDRVWLERVTGERMFADGAVTSLAQELYADFDTLRRERAATDERIMDFVDALRDDDLLRVVTYTSLLGGPKRSLRLDGILMHLFHHQTHHRGQITTLIGQLGHDFGDTDMILMPEFTVTGQSS
ncbi:MAG: DinB family protein [Chromatiales bacterium]|jgi:uncharacterized damage-inducible protein DinB|nr:DinB family protein [Chromatiales bacterium]MDX9766990.1 DinB family protein [Ectothiorhodospiraceae bacterium]